MAARSVGESEGGDGGEIGGGSEGGNGNKIGGWV